MGWIRRVQLGYINSPSNGSSGGDGDGGGGTVPLLLGHLSEIALQLVGQDTGSMCFWENCYKRIRIRDGMVLWFGMMWTN